MLPNTLPTFPVFRFVFVRSSIAISALGRMGKWQKAVEVLDGMGTGGDGSDRPDAFAYAAAINACGKAGRPVEVSDVRRE